MSDFATRDMRFTRAESVLAQWMESSSGESIEDLCRLHSEIALELRELHLACSSLERPRATGSQGAPAAGARPRGFEQATCRYADYTVGESFARGGMGEILEVRDEVLRRDLAMKRLRDDTSLRGPNAALAEHKLARFFAEARITSQLDHPGVVPVHELGFDPAGRPYFTMKRVRGRTLAEVFDLCAHGDEAWSQTRVLGVLMRVCETMAYAHSRGVIHRDLKPANVMVGDFGEVYVMDWGLARAEREAAPERAGAADDAAPATDSERELAPESIQARTLHGDVIGTPQYMPPEQATGQLERVGPTSDVYAVGAMLYQLLAGRAPYVELTRTLPAVALLSRVIAAPPEPIGAIAPRNTPPELIAICERAMRRDSAQRYADMHELASELSAYLEHRVVRAHQTGPWVEARKWIERNRALALSALAALLCLVAGLLVSLYLLDATIEERDMRSAAEREAQTRRKEADKARALSDRQAVTLVERSVEIEKARELAAEEARVAQAVNRFLEEDLFGSIDPERARGRQWTLREAVDAGAANIESAFEDQPALAARLHQTLGRVYGSLGEYGLSRSHLERSLARFELASNAKPLDVARSFTLLAQLAHALDDDDQAVLHAQRALELVTSATGKDDSAVASASADVEMYAAMSKGRLAAELGPVYLVLFATFRGRGETPDQVRDLIAERLSAIEREWNAGRREAAIEIVLESAQSALETADFSEKVPQGLGSFGVTTLWEAGMFGAAEALVLGAMRIAESRLGPEHTHTLLTRWQLASIRETQRRFDEAIELFRGVYCDRARIWGALHRDTFSCAWSWGKCCALAEQYDEAACAFSLALTASLAAYGEWHWRAQECRIRLGASCTRAGRFVEAEVALLDALNHARPKPKSGGDTTCHVAAELAELYQRWGRESQAQLWRALAQSAD